MNRVLNTATDGFTTGMAFDASKKLYVTNFSGQTVSVLDSAGELVGTFGSDYYANPESILFDASGNVYVGQADGEADILKFDPQGNLLEFFDVATGPRGSDWIELAPDQCTMFYTSEGTAIKRFNVCTNTQLPDFASGLHGAAYALRLRPNGEVLVADTVDIHRLNSSGEIIQTYNATGESHWFALNLDPDGTSFWSADFETSNVYKFDIATGTLVPPFSFNTGTPPNTVFGLVVHGELTGAISLEQLDPVSALISGREIIADDTQENVEALATKGSAREGVAADGLASLVLRVSAPGPGRVDMFLVAADGEPLLDHAENGFLTDLEGIQVDGFVSVGTHDTAAGHKAFAVYHAPSRFVREGQPGDVNLEERRVFFKTRFTSLAGQVINAAPVASRIVRPPVVLVHGIWSDSTAWNRFSPLVMNGTDSDPRFRVYRVQYPNDRDFATGSDKVYSDLKGWILLSRKERKVASIQADVITHSMGGPVVRTMALSGNYSMDPLFPTFGRGPVRRLITIDGVHLGTRMANLLLETPCAAAAFDGMGRATGNGAVRDLAEGSTAIQGINSMPARFPVHTVVGLASDEQRRLNSGLLQARIDNIFVCRGNVFPGVDAVLGPENDVLVARDSQRGGREGGDAAVSEYMNVLHSDPFLPAGNQVLRVRIIAERVVELLNATEEELFTPLP